MWTPIFLQNKDNILEALNGYINNLEDLKKLIINNDKESIIKDLYNYRAPNIKIEKASSSLLELKNYDGIINRLYSNI